MVSTSGDPLVGQEVVEALTTQLLPLAQLVTPNLPEASGLLGKQDHTHTHTQRWTHTYVREALSDL